MAIPQIQGLARTSDGRLAGNTLVTVRDYATGRLSSLYTDEVCSAGANPIPTDADGAFAAYVNDGRYRIVQADGFTLPCVTAYTGLARTRFVFKTGNETEVGAVLQDDNSLRILQFDNGGTYSVRVMLYVSGSATGFKYTFATTNLTGKVHGCAIDHTGLAVEYSAINDWTATVDMAGFAGTPSSIIVAGLATAAGGNGTLTLRWCTSAGGGAAATVHAGSWMRATKIGAAA